MTEDEFDPPDGSQQGILEHIVWTSRLDVGIKAIDADHRSMIKRFNSIVDASPLRDRSELATLLEQLGNATAEHFETEEKLMAELDYEYSTAHLKEHRDLLQEYGHQVEDWRANRVSAEAMCRFMYRWLLHHIVVADKPLGEAIQHQSGS